MAKKPVRGICKLCLKEKDLLDSHLMPKALYSLGESKKVNQIKVTPDYVMTTSRHVRTYLLCLGCETLLNREGENWLLPLLARPDGRFELYESVTRSQPFAGVSQIAVYSCNNIPAVNVHSVTH